MPRCFHTRLQASCSIFVSRSWKPKAVSASGAGAAHQARHLLTAVAALAWFAHWDPRCLHANLADPQLVDWQVALQLAVNFISHGAYLSSWIAWSACDFASSSAL